MSTQEVFAQALLDPGRERPAGLQGAGGVPARLRFDVYRNNVVVSLIAALETGFPVVRALVGAEFFSAMAGEFARAHPPDSPLLMLYGAAFPGFLATFPPVAHLGYLPDVARLELALRESYHAADAAPIDAADLAGLSPAALARARLRLAPALRVLRSDWPVLGIWQTHHGGPRPAAGPEEMLIARPGFDPAPHRLPAGGVALIKALAGGMALGQAVARAPAEFQESNIPEILRILLDTAAITGIETE